MKRNGFWGPLKLLWFGNAAGESDARLSVNQQARFAPSGSCELGTVGDAREICFATIAGAFLTMLLLRFGDLEVSFQELPVRQFVNAQLGGNVNRDIFQVRRTKLGYARGKSHQWWVARLGGRSS